MDYYTLALVLFAVYWLIVIYLNYRGVLARHGVSAYGPLLMLRTTRGLELLDKLAAPRRFWQVFATVGIPLTVVAMFFMLGVLLLGDFRLLLTQPAPSALNAPRNVLLLPGINQFIPLTWGLIGLIVTLVAHEFSHAILSRVADIKVKSLGLLLALVPIGAFAEPDESQLLGIDAEPETKVATRQERLRVFTAGIMANFVVAFIALTLFFGPVLSAVTPVEGQGVVGVISGSPAEKVGIQPGMIVYQIDATNIRSDSDFQAFMNTTHDGQLVTIQATDQGTQRIFMATLDKNPDQEKGFLGIRGSPQQTLNFLKGLPAELDTFQGWAALIGFPLLIFSGFTGNLVSFYQPIGWAAPLGNSFFWIANALLWIGWINFYVGLFNCLPAGPLDGGQIFKELFKSLTEKIIKDRREQERLTNALVTTLGVVILASFLLLLIGPYVFSAF
ncbi:MAG: site-2 protease family protein [Halobacteriota archaeon]